MELEFGNTYTGKVVELQQAGALVLIHPNKPPVFVRNSQLDLKKVSLLYFTPAVIDQCHKSINLGSLFVNNSWELSY